MEIEIDPDVKATVEFMQSNIPAARLVAVSEGVGSLAPILWGRYAPERIETLSLAHNQPAMRSEISPPTASGSEPKCSDAGGGSAAVKDGTLPT